MSGGLEAFSVSENITNGLFKKIFLEFTMFFANSHAIRLVYIDYELGTVFRNTFCILNSYHIYRW